MTIEQILSCFIFVTIAGLSAIGVEIIADEFHIGGIFTFIADCLVILGLMFLLTRFRPQ